MQLLLDKRLWLVLFLMFVLQLSGGLTVLGSMYHRPLTVDAAHGSGPDATGQFPTRPVEPPPGPFETLRRELIAQRIPVVNPDGTPAGPPMGPLAAAFAFGGFVMMLGGVGAVLLWRRATEAEAEPEASDGIVRNTAR